MISNTQKFRAICGTLIAMGLALAPARMVAQTPAPGQQPAAATETAGQHFKNVQVLKDIPWDQLQPSMQVITMSLGVRCEFCHVEGANDKDDKDNKKTARAMMTMMININKDNFDGRRQVTCYTCHKGVNDPVSTPVIPDPATIMAMAQQERAGRGEGRGAGRGQEPAGANAQPALPTLDQVVQKYTQAIGGSDAIGKLTSREAHGDLENTNFKATFDQLAEAPNKSVNITHTQQGDFMQGFDGTTAWQGGGRGGPREQTGPALLNAKRNADFFRTLDLKKSYPQMRVIGMTKINERDAYVVFGRAANGTGNDRLFFDAENGLLVRILQVVVLPLGNLPTQIDYSDYRAVNGVKVPFTIVSARPDDASTYHFTDIKFNTPVDDSKFAMPAAKAPGGNL